MQRSTLDQQKEELRGSKEALADQVRQAERANVLAGRQLFTSYFGKKHKEIRENLASSWVPHNIHLALLDAYRPQAIPSDTYNHWTLVWRSLHASMKETKRDIELASEIYQAIHSLSINCESFIDDVSMAHLENFIDSNLESEMRSILAMNSFFKSIYPKRYEEALSDF
ncbi:hypothetical protein [Aestuariispira ectoiniformans]|uniref:hypothetical protein n=1 Tax=Aestuariispira ectoiniformans TaxID=2775080 RepID=UPI00223ABA4A|nr:hypothetical protein [Aestuariispira ectoiniformans]